MRLASFRTAQGASYGAVTNKGIVDLGRRLGNRYPISGRFWKGTVLRKHEKRRLRRRLYKNPT